MVCLSEFLDISSFVLLIASLLIGIATLIVTSITLKWFMDDRKNQDNKEFTNLIYDNIKDISVYKLDIIECNSLGKYTKMARIEEAERQIVLGQSFLDLYGKIHNLPYLKEFSAVNGNSKRKKYSFMYNFFRLNFAYHEYRKKLGENSFSADSKLNDYYKVFSRYLELASKYSLSVLCLKELIAEDEQVKKYYAELKRIIKYEVKKGLL